MENNFIVLTPETANPEGLGTLTWNDLYTANFSLTQPFCLRLDNNELFICEKIIRLVPKKRLVVFGLWRGEKAAAKLFIDPRHAKRHIEKDAAGIKSLQKNKIPTPELLNIGETIDHRVQVLMLKRILHSKSLDEIWQERRLTTEDNLLIILKAVVIEIATQHVLGLLQHDLHLKNFLLTEKTIYTLDGAQFETFPHLLSRNISINNLALFLSQLGIAEDALQEILFKHYNQARGWTVKPEDIVELFFLIQKWNEARWKNFEKKIYRDCTQFACIKHWKSFCMYDRSYYGPELLQFLTNPERDIYFSKGKLLKAGRSATVFKIKMDKRDYVVKRYNIKNGWHRLRRFFRPTRAASSWRWAQKLSLFGILTAKPVAFIEQRFLGVRGKSYYITEYISEENAADYFLKNSAYPLKINSMVEKICSLLKSLIKMEITHGDLKITNILINENEEPVIIDLDGAMEHFSLYGLKKTWKKDLERFLQNFSDNPMLQKKFEAEFEKW